MKQIDRAYLLRSLQSAADVHETVAARTDGAIRQHHTTVASSLHTMIACIDAGYYDVREETETK